MQDWQGTIAACRKQVVASHDHYKTIQSSLCGLIDSVRLSISGGKSGEALQKLGRLKDGVNGAWETVLTDKTDQVALLDAVECLVSSTKSLLDKDQNNGVHRAEGACGDAIAAVIRYLDPDRDRNSPKLEDQRD